MKKTLACFLFIVLVVASIAVCNACGQLPNSRYYFMLPDAYEADATYTCEYYTDTYSMIWREQEIAGATYKVYYFSYRTVSSEYDITREYFNVWNDTKMNYDVYLWDEEEAEWKPTDRISATEYSNNYALANQATLYEKDAVKKTAEYIEFHWGNKTSPDVVRLSNDDYHFCLYHEYAGSNSTFTVTRVTLGTSERAIPHFSAFSFANN